MKRKTEYQQFTEMVDGVLSMPHREIKAKLDAEKRTKKRKNSRKSSRFPRGSLVGQEIRRTHLASNFPIGEASRERRCAHYPVGSVKSAFELVQ